MVKSSDLRVYMSQNTFESRNCYAGCECISSKTVQIYEECVKFDDNCLKGQVDLISKKSNCSECNIPYYFDQQSNKCVKYDQIQNCLMYSQKYDTCLKCKDGFFFNSVQKICSQCQDDNCQSCGNDGLCYKCLESYYLVTDQKSSCLKDCPNNYYIPLQKSKLCIQKEQSFNIEYCEKLSYNQANGAICEKCQIGFVLKNNNCQKQCQIENCQICQGEQSCKLCVDKYFLYNAPNQVICVQQCPDQYFKTSYECIIKEIIKECGSACQEINSTSEQLQPLKLIGSLIGVSVFCAVLIISNLVFYCKWQKYKKRKIKSKNQVLPDGNQYQNDYPQGPPYGYPQGPPPAQPDNINVIIRPN